MGDISDPKKKEKDGKKKPKESKERSEKAARSAEELRGQSKKPRKIYKEVYKGSEEQCV